MTRCCVGKGGLTTPLRQRVIDDLRLKNFSDGTIKVYVRAVEKFARFLGRSPDESTAEDVRAFMVHQLDRGLSRSYCVILRNALRHLYQDTLGRTDELQAVPRPKRERRLPVVLSRQEVQRLFAVVENIKHKALFMMAYDAGLRLSEVLNLRIEDIDSQRMVIRICQAKGKKGSLRPAVQGAAQAVAGVLASLLSGIVAVSGGRPAQTLRRLHAGTDPQAAVPQSRHQQAGEHAHAASQFCDPSAGSRHQPACDSTVARALKYSDNLSLHAHLDRAAARSSQPDGTAPRS